MLLLPGFSFAFSLLILVLAVIHDLAHGRRRSGSDLNEVKPLLPSKLQRFANVYDTDLLARVVYEPTLSGPDSLVDPELSVYMQSPRKKLTTGQQILCVPIDSRPAVVVNMTNASVVYQISVNLSTQSGMPLHAVCLFNPNPPTTRCRLLLLLGWQGFVLVRLPPLSPLFLKLFGTFRLNEEGWLVLPGKMIKAGGSHTPHRAIGICKNI